jgi:hypothetical protein
MRKVDPPVAFRSTGESALEALSSGSFGHLYGYARLHQEWSFGKLAEVGISFP